MNVRLNLKRLRLDLDSLGYLVDLAMIGLILLNLGLILFDWLFRIPAVQDFLHMLSPAFFSFYRDTVHANFLEIDLWFVAVFLTEFVIRWGFAIGRRTYHRWFFYPFAHWYDLLGCIPVGSFRWLRILRVISLMYRLQKRGVVDFTETYLGRTVLKYYRILVEEISDRVVINILEGAQREIVSGGQLMHRIEQDVLLPRRDELVDYLGGRIADATRRSHDQYRDQLGDYLNHLTNEAVNRTPAGRRLAAIPVAGPRAVALLGETVRDAGDALVEQLVEDISAPANRERLDRLINDLINTATSGQQQQLNTLIRETLLDILEEVKAQIAVQHWKHEEADERMLEEKRRQEARKARRERRERKARQ
ncbi:ion transporter [Alloalcanivorax xenomutans]|uniref:ion transporter n=1 Tax=Alloalcanivorax xenomutans TaxID=1094342 RepID=UPI001F2B8526|nr:ion transporter [Alloalcanivorax xenomutans]MCE7521738.1 ion transporter [Alloalcanivorax xenomutans]